MTRLTKNAFCHLRFALEVPGKLCLGSTRRYHCISMHSIFELRKPQQDNTLQQIAGCALGVAPKAQPTLEDKVVLGLMAIQVQPRCQRRAAMTYTNTISVAEMMEVCSRFAMGNTISIPAK